ncbi:MAG: CBS domain-containing protein, partial [Deltaproteobacteria bacterium]|nr:CBS domain-containing protein [Deltaproteobacteria bacterium]
IRSERLYTIGGINVVIAKISLEGYKGDVSTLAQRMMEMEHIDALVLLAETPDRVHLVIRSSAGSLNAGALARELGGGGHLHAASATLKALTLIEADEEVLQALKKVITPKVTASDIMSSPAITTLKGKTIESALELMRRYNINALAVTSKKKPIGVITRQVVDKALHHGLKGELVSELMNPGRLIVKRSTSTDEVRDIVMTHGQRILSVIDDKSGDLAGIITRTDLLKLLREGLREKETTSDIMRQSKRKKKIASFMKEKLPSWTLNLLKDIGETADSLGFEAYAVGGFVRDILLMLEDTSGGAGKMDRKDLDIDIVIEGDAVRFARCFARKNSLHVKSHLRFKSSTIKFPNGFKLDVATARLEYYDHPGALPNVAHSSLKLDLYRRDFTINTLAMALNPDEFAEVIDFFGARDDIKRRKIRILHNLSFVEDPIRALRAIRFSERFGFDISPHTLKLIKNSIRLNLLRKSSGPRILDELK